MNRFFKIIYSCINLLLPIKKKTILFSSFFGQYNDNPKYICDEFKTRHPDYKIYWVVSNKSREALPTYVNKVYFRSKLYYQMIFRAEIVVDNHFSCRQCESGSSFSEKLYAKFFTKSRKGQLVVSTWHGTALKYIGLTKGKTMFTNTDVLALGNDLIKKQILENYKYNFDVRVVGSPRNDILFDTDTENVKRLKIKLGLPLDKKIIIYAPTFRGADENYGIDIVESVDFGNILNRLKQRFGGDWCFVLRLHHVALGALLNNKATFALGKNVIDANVGDDMGEYLACSDVLITDYSSNMFDFIVTKKPCLLFAPDFDKYKDVTRGFLLNPEALPFGIAKDSQELLQIIDNFDNEKYIKDIEKFMIDNGYQERGNASQRVVDLIDEFIIKGKKDLHERKE